MNKLLASERRIEIAQLLVRDGKVCATELSKRYDVSSETIRKDLTYLEARGIAEKNYGGAIATSRAIERTFLEKAFDCPDEKHGIAQLVTEMIPQNASVLLDSGSTVLEVAKLLVSRLDLTFFTNSLDSASLLAEKNRNVCILGGTIRHSSHAVTGVWTSWMLEHLNIDVAILGTSGFANSDGPCVESMEECAVKHAMIHSSKHVILVADSTKSRCRAPIRFADWEEIDTLVTDDDITPETLEILQCHTHVQILHLSNM